MSSSRSGRKTDLLVKVRFQNPLPPPPFAPKLLHIPTNPARYTSYDFLAPLCAEREIPLVLDGELGMPLELGKIPKGSYGDGGYWSGDRSKIAPSQAAAPLLDEADAFLLDASSVPLAPGLLPSGGSGVAADRKKTEVSWLRRTEYLSSEASKVASSAIPTVLDEPQEEMSREKRLLAVQATFNAARSDIAELKHPTKKYLRAVEAFDFLPDEDLYATTNSLVRFGENPGEDPTKGGPPRSTGEDVRLPRAVFRPVEIPNEGTRVGYFLPADDAVAVAYEQRRRNPDTTSEDGTFEFRHIRDYEIAGSRPLGHEYILSFVEDVKDKDGQPAKRKKGAYYSSVSQVLSLRNEDQEGENPKSFPASVRELGNEFWDGIQLGVKGVGVLDEDELQNRNGLLKEVMEPPRRLENS